jgi:DNA-binding LacI/PurR family transcriptional regulator
LGHERVLYVGGPPDLRTTHQRLEGLREGLGPTGRVDATYGDYREQSGYELVRERLATDYSFTAVFAGNDMMALGAMRALTEGALSLPGDVSVVGYDDIPLAAFVSPSLTTIRQPVYAIGHAAAEQLIASLSQRRPLPQGRVILDVELIERGSTAIARQAALA